MIDPRGDVHVITAVAESCEVILRAASASVDLLTFGDALSVETSPPVTVFPIEYPQGLQQAFRERESCSQVRIARTIGDANTLVLAYGGGNGEALLFGRDGYGEMIEGSNAMRLGNKVDDVCEWLAEQ